MPATRAGLPGFIPLPHVHFKVCAACDDFTE